jgi:hypothetical protein
MEGIARRLVDLEAVVRRHTDDTGAHGRHVESQPAFLQQVTRLKGDLAVALTATDKYRRLWTYLLDEHLSPAAIPFERAWLPRVSDESVSIDGPPAVGLVTAPHKAPPMAEA